MNVLVIDIGGTNVKFVAGKQKTVHKFSSGRNMGPRDLVAGIKERTANLKYDVVSIGYPGVVRDGRIISEPQNLGPGWVGFDFTAAFQQPVKLINDAAMQALGSYRGGLMLFVGLGTGIGSALIVDGIVVPLELGHLPYKQKSYEDYVGLRGLKWLGQEKWQGHVIDILQRLIETIHPDDAVVGGGLTKDLEKLPKGCRRGNNSYAFLGGIRLWKDTKRKKEK